MTQDAPDSPDAPEPPPSAPAPEPADDAPVPRVVELPTVTLGDPDDDGPAPSVRLLQGRAPLRWTTYPIYAALFISGGAALDTALRTREWEPGVVVLAWALLYLWIAVYSVAWSYRRVILQALILLLLTGYHGVLAFLCIDRAAPQGVWNGAQLIVRPELPPLQWSAALLLTSACWLLVHALYLGRGYRSRSPIPPT